MLGIVNCGVGNLESIRNAFDRVGCESYFASTPEEVLKADRLVLPGVGAAGEALACLRAKGLEEALAETVRKRARPMLGICVGMQILAEKHFEFGEHRGLGWIKGEAKNLSQLPGIGGPVPHMGWNEIRLEGRAGNLTQGIWGALDFYFAHSFFLQPSDEGVIAATADYGGTFVAAVKFDTVLATQFHPEKSQINGEKLLENFLAWSP